MLHPLPFSESLALLRRPWPFSEALAICREDPPDLMILDLDLPDGSGLAVAEQLAERRPEAQLIVL